MSDSEDRLAALIQNGQLLRDYNVQTGVLPASGLDDALNAVCAQNPPSYHSEETGDLRKEVARMVNVIKPTTLVELRDFYPYTSPHRSGRKIFARWTFRLFFTVFALCLLYTCAYYTLWSKRATQFMNEVQVETSRLAEEQLAQVLNRWDLATLLLESAGVQAEREQSGSPAQDFRVYLDYHQKYTELLVRQRSLQGSYRISLLGADDVAMSAWSSLAGIGQTAETEQPATTAATGDGPTPDAPLTGNGAASAPAPDDATDQFVAGAVQNVQVGGVGPPPKSTRQDTALTGAPPVPPDGGTYTRNPNESCLDMLTAAVERLKQDAQATRRAASDAPFLAMDASAPVATEAWLAIRAREINVNAFRCFFKVPPEQEVDVRGMRFFYIDSVRYIRDKLDILNSWLLPGLYGAMGAVLLTLRIMVNPLQPSPASFRTFIRVILGGFVGVVIGWFWAPKSGDLFEFANISLGLFTVAFLFGYGIDIFFGILERVIGFVSDAFEKARPQT